MIERPFWSDDFDMDLPKIFPDARKMLGDLGDIELVTSGTPDKPTGRLNHPNVWNTDHGCAAFFGFGNPGRDTSFYVTGYAATDIRCTAWEAFRDAWAHHFIMVIDRRRVWDTAELWRHFEAIMYDVRGWGDRNPRYAKIRAKASYAEAIRNFGRIINDRRAAGRAITIVQSSEAT